MVCAVCSRTTQQNESTDCFETALETIKQHYTFYRNSIRKRDIEMLQLKERNEELLKALQLLQKSQPPAKRLKANVEGSWLSPNPSNRNTYKEDASTDLSLTDDDDNDVASGASNLNVALNSEQLFETSVLSPAGNVSHSEIITSPRTRESPRRNKQRDESRSHKDRNQLLRKSISECHTKERSSPSDKSWASKFIKPTVKVKVTENIDGPDTKKPERKLNLSLKRVNPSKVKQSLLHFNNSKESSIVESDVCDDIIDASPVVNKNSKTGLSWAQRSGLSHSNALNNSSLVGAETRQCHEDTTSTENLVFDFSPTKKPLHADVTGSLSCKQLNFSKEANELTSDCAEIPPDQSTMGSESSSVVILTPATQDIIFLDDTCDEINNADTMDMLADIMKQDNTETLKKLKQYESKNMEKHLRQIESKSKFAKEKKVPVIEPLTSVKKEKCTQLIMEKSKEMEENVLMGLTALNREDDRHINPLLHEAEEEEEDDAMPIPFLIKQESQNKTAFKKRSLMERFNINCDDCEKYVNFFGDSLPDDELAKHINKCSRHKQPENLRQNTPADFWNPFILSFPQNDPRNEVLYDNRSKNKGQMGKH